MDFTVHKERTVRKEVNIKYVALQSVIELRCALKHEQPTVAEILDDAKVVYNWLIEQ